jgi:hypothetical protein
VCLSVELLGYLGPSNSKRCDIKLVLYCYSNVKVLKTFRSPNELYIYPIIYPIDTSYLDASGTCLCFCVTCAYKQQLCTHIYRVFKKSLCTWWLRYRILQVMFKVSPASLQTFIDTPKCVFEDRVQYSTVYIPNVFCDDHLQIISHQLCNRQVHREFLIILCILLQYYFVAVCSGDHAESRLLGLWVRIPTGYECFSVVSVLCCQVEVSAMSWSLVQRVLPTVMRCCVWSRTSRVMRPWSALCRSSTKKISCTFCLNRY